MPVRRLRNRWGVDIRANGRRIRLRCPENSRAAAVAYEARLRNQLALKGPEALFERKMRVFREAAEEWFQNDVLVNRKPAVRIQYRRMLDTRVLPVFGARRIGDIRTLEIERFKGSLLRTGLAPGSVNNALIVLSRFFRCAVEWGWLEHRPKCIWLRVPPSRFVFLSHEECRKLRLAAQPTPWHDMIVCAYRTGMRLGELEALRWEDVDLRHRVITVRRSFSAGVETSPKNHRGRAIPMTEDLHQVFSVRPHKDGYVFLADRNQRAFRSAAAHAILRLERELGLDKHFSWHTLRHAFASHLMAAGVPITTVQALMGHSSIQMTMRYAHLGASALTTAMAALSVAESAELAEVDGHPMGTNAEDRPFMEHVEAHPTP